MKQLMVKWCYRLAVAVTGIDTVKLLTVTKCKITSTGLEGIGVSGGVAVLFKLPGASRK
jgi:hypothetical protein